MYYRRSTYKSTLTPAEREAKAEAAFQRKIAKMEANRAKSKFDYPTAGGSYIPTLRQYEHALTMVGNPSAEIVITGYMAKLKVNHDHIHIVNESIRNL
jgi:hypothetical protein